MKRVVHHVLPYSIGIGDICPINCEQTPVSLRNTKVLKWGTKSPNKYLTRSSGIVSVACSQDTSSQCSCTKFSLTTFHSTEVVSNPLVAMIVNQYQGSKFKYQSTCILNLTEERKLNLNQVYFNSNDSKSNSNLLYKKNKK